MVLRKPGVFILGTLLISIFCLNQTGFAQKRNSPAPFVLDAFKPLPQIDSRSANTELVFEYNLDQNWAAEFWGQANRAQIRLVLDIDGETLHKELQEIDLMAPASWIENEQEVLFDIEKGRHYYFSSPDTMMTLSVFPDKILGQFSWGGHNWSLAPVLSNPEEYVLVSDQELPSLASQNSACYLQEDPSEDLIRRIQASSEERIEIRGQLPPLDIYFELDYYVFQEQERSVEKAVQYFINIFNNVALLFQREGIQVRIKGLKVWTTPDPFSDLSASAGLANFKSYLNREFNEQNWDMAMLISRYSTEEFLGPNGGLAGMDGLCNRLKRSAYANIYDYYEEFPAFSWSVFVIAHELGHVIASPHTHNCFWPGGPIDDCYCPEGRCDLANSADPRGGTLMSYCYLKGPFSGACNPLPRDSNPSINFLLGFGELPGNLMRETIARKSCLNNKSLDSLPNLNGALRTFPILEEDSLVVSGLILYNQGARASTPFSMQVFQTQAPGFETTYEPFQTLLLPVIPARDSFLVEEAIRFFVEEGWVYGIQLDAKEEVTEYDEGDNTIWLDVPQAKLDLSINQKGILRDTNTYFTVQQFQIFNSQNNTSPEGQLDYYLSQDTLLGWEDYWISSTLVPEIPPNSALEMNLLVFKPKLLVPGGSYYVAYHLRNRSGLIPPVNLQHGSFFDTLQTIQLKEPLAYYYRAPSPAEMSWNPLERSLSLSFDTISPSPVELLLRNRLGQVVWQKRMFPKTRPEKRFDLSFLPSGQYWLSYQAGSDFYTKKIIVRD